MILAKIDKGGNHSALDFDLKPSLMVICLSSNVGETNKKFEFHFKTEHFKMLPGDYTVGISSKLISNFKNKNKTVQYWIALENTSKYEG